MLLECLPDILPQYLLQPKHRIIQYFLGYSIEIYTINARLLSFCCFFGVHFMQCCFNRELISRCCNQRDFIWANAIDTGLIIAKQLDGVGWVIIRNVRIGLGMNMRS